MRLEVQPGNRAAIARYEKSGYRRTGRLPGYYNDGSDALRYEKVLVKGVTAWPARACEEFCE